MIGETQLGTNPAYEQPYAGKGTPGRRRAYLIGHTCKGARAHEDGWTLEQDNLNCMPGLSPQITTNHVS